MLFLLIQESFLLSQMLAAGHSDNLRMMQLDELNGVQLCRLGQEIVQEIVQRTCDVFLSLKQVKVQ
jgi:hypothetical protein